MADPIHLSNSRLTMLARCPKQFEFVYVKGMRRPPDIALVTGRAVDSSVNQNLTDKIHGGLGLPLEQVQQIATEAVSAAVERDGISLLPEEAAAGVKPTLGAAKDRAVRLATRHAEHVAPRIQPVSVQEHFQIEIDSEGGLIEMEGYADVLESSGALRDTKTSGKSPVKNAAHQSMQLTAYAMMRLVQDGLEVKDLYLDTIVDTGSTTKEVIQSTSRTRQDLLRYLDRARAGASLIRSGNFYPTDPSNWWCSKNWCGFWDICPHALRPVAVLVGDATGRVEPDQKGSA